MLVFSAYSYVEQKSAVFRQIKTLMSTHYECGYFFEIYIVTYFFVFIIEFVDNCFSKECYSIVTFKNIH